MNWLSILSSSGVNAAVAIAEWAERRLPDVNVAVRIHPFDWRVTAVCDTLHGIAFVTVGPIQLEAEW